ncbi:MAG: ribose 5-phosphate isomerase B [Firmicutes bacterium]|uniref:Ribose 5-phosphate isomerase B n=1 Tax=Melghirimyces thermohalophilus TaxID=1236220 RepID=A0A1G6MB41_9BACL|nr:ribose 5-phosphate isomerase B [Melghirimyces thermohalophilus]MDA8353755.1 ribose 5-phosphate isomerase B [Bacillota bacterium]SDC52733.1 ribose 5-phosphate isomerase B [Melghirimyces thermohalophilus]
MKIIIGSDHGGLQLKESIKEVLDELKMEVEDVGCDCADSVDYPDYALPVAERVAAGEFDRGILICGTGIGMSIAANKVSGCRCAVVSDEYSARMSREHNDANVLALGERVMGPGLAEAIVRTWLSTEFAGGRHQQRVDKICTLEKE